MTEIREGEEITVPRMDCTKQITSRSHASYQGTQGKSFVSIVARTGHQRWIANCAVERGNRLLGSDADERASKGPPVEPGPCMGWCNPGEPSGVDFV